MDRDESTSVLKDGLAAFDLPTSKWKTLLAFLLGDAVGVLLLTGSVFLGLQLSGAPLDDTSVGLLGLLSAVLLAFLLFAPFRQRYCHPALEMPHLAAVTGVIGGTAALTIGLYAGSWAVALPIAAWGGLGMIVVPLCRGLTRVLGARTSWWGAPAVILADGESGDGILRTLRRWPEIGLRPVAVLRDTEPDQSSESLATGPYEWAPYLAQQYSIPYLIVARPALTHTERSTLLIRYAKFFDHVIVVPDLPTLTAFWTTTESGDGLFGYSVRHAALQPGSRLLKRLLDVAGAGLLLLLCLPLFAVIAFAIRQDSPGGVFYGQERMGREGRIVPVLKFRTMYTDAHQRLEEILDSDPERRAEYERYHKLKDDPRVTSVGEFLRRYSLDELPQLINVLRGDMSLVGPRAYMPSELPKMKRLAQSVLQVPPGMTGLWQVSGRNQLSFQERLELDVHYVQNWSSWLDLYLLVRTVPTVLSGEGAS